MRDWPMLAGVSFLMITGYVGAAWSLRDQERPGRIRQACRSVVARTGWLLRGFRGLTRTQRVAVFWAAGIALLVMTRAVFELAEAAHTEQGVIVGLFVLVALAVAATIVALTSLREHVRGR